MGSLQRVGLLFGVLLAGLTSYALPVSARELVSTITVLDRLPPPPRADFKVPSEPNMLFYLQRSTNANTIVYAANVIGPGRIDPNNPIDVFWRRYTEHGERRDLDFIQRTLAYGATPRPVAGHPNEFDANIVSFPEVRFRVGMDQTGNPEAIFQIDGRRARLVSAYVKLDESGLIPELIYMDIVGIDKASGRVLDVHLEPAKS